MKRTKGPDDKKGAARKAVPFWHSEATAQLVTLPAIYFIYRTATLA